MKNEAKLRNLNTLAEYVDDLQCNPELRYLFFELTDACNMACLHCGSNASPNNRSYLSFESVSKVLTSVSNRYDARKIMVCLTGGEPLLHPDFFEIVSLSHKLGFKCGITTNGYRIDEETALRMHKSGVQSVGISIDGTEQMHDWFRNVRGAYRRAFNAVKNLASASDGAMSLQVTTVIHKQNISTLDEIYDEVLRMKADSWRIINIEPIGRALTHPELLLDRSDLRYILNYIRDKRFSVKTPIHVTFGCSHYLGEEFENEVRDHYFMCMAGLYVGSVLANGDIYPCLDIERRPELVQGNIGKDDFCDVWENGFKFFRGERSRLCEDCKKCDEHAFCRGDSAHTWDYNNNKPLMCYKKYYE